MKTTKIIHLIMLLCISIGTGCDKASDDLILEVSFEGDQVSIQREIEGIAFKFCLLNNQGEPAVVFHEGDDFIFQFEFSNQNTDNITVTTEFVNSDFLRVFKLDENQKTDMGTPWTGVWCEYSNTPEEINLAPYESKVISIPWSSKGNYFDYYPLCKGEEKEALSYGQYFTECDLNFHYRINGRERVINNVKFKINFEID